MCMMTSQGINIIPYFVYTFEGYEVRDKMKKALQDTKIIGLNVRIEQINNTTKSNKKHSEEDKDNVVKVKLKSTPWQITDVQPWCKYKVAIQLVTKDFGTSLYSDTTETNPADLNVLFKYTDLKNELLWAKHYKEYAPRVDLKKVESLLKKYTDKNNDFETLTKKVKADEKVKDGGFRPRDAKVIRISGVVRNLLNEEPEKKKDIYQKNRERHKRIKSRSN